MRRAENAAAVDEVVVVTRARSCFEQGYIDEIGEPMMYLQQIGASAKSNLRQIRIYQRKYNEYILLARAGYSFVRAR